MKRTILALASAAVVGLTACSHTAVSANHGTVPVPVSCGKRYNIWEHSQGEGLLAAVNAVSSAEISGDTHVLTDALKKAKPAVARGARQPVPACADPMGYWSVLLMHVNAAAASTGSASSMQAAMKDVPKIEDELITEVQHTAR